MCLLHSCTHVPHTVYLPHQMKHYSVNVVVIYIPQQHLDSRWFYSTSISSTRSSSWQAFVSVKIHTWLKRRGRGCKQIQIWNVSLSLGLGFSSTAWKQKVKSKIEVPKKNFKAFLLDVMHSQTRSRWLDTNSDRASHIHTLNLWCWMLLRKQCLFFLPFHLNVIPLF